MNALGLRSLLPSILLFVACAGPAVDANRLRLKGPLDPLVDRLPESLAACDSVAREYAQPFRRAPFRECAADSDGHRQVLEIDADSVLTQSYATWTVDRAARDGRFTRLAAAMDSAFGPGRRCGPRKVEWQQGDTLHAILQATPAGDVGDLEASPTWRVTRLMRLGPLDPTTWACQPLSPAL